MTAIMSSDPISKKFTNRPKRSRYIESSRRMWICSWNSRIWWRWWIRSSSIKNKLSSSINTVKLPVLWFQGRMAKPMMLIKGRSPRGNRTRRWRALNEELKHARTRQRCQKWCKICLIQMLYRPKIKAIWVSTSIQHHSFKTAKPTRFSSWSSNLAVRMLTPTANIKGTRRISTPYTTTIIWTRQHQRPWTPAPKVNHSSWSKTPWRQARMRSLKSSESNHETRLCSVPTWRISICCLATNSWIGPKPIFRIWLRMLTSEISQWLRLRIIIIIHLTVQSRFRRCLRQINMVEAEQLRHSKLRIKLSHHGHINAKRRPRVKSTIQIATQTKWSNPSQSQRSSNLTSYAAAKASLSSNQANTRLQSRSTTRPRAGRTSHLWIRMVSWNFIERKY